ncbi:MAG: MFS transporter, partial [Anaerolineales bacterium]
MKKLKIGELNRLLLPADLNPTQRRNFINVQVDAIGVGLASAAAPFLPVFLTRLGATNQQVGYLTSMPALTGLLLGIFVGRFLQTKKNIVTWFSIARLMVLASYAITALLIGLVPNSILITAILVLWAVVTLPQTVVAVSFNVVMSSVAGPEHRYDLMSRRWSILGITTALATASAGQLLEHLPFPLNYQIMFFLLSVGSLISFYFSSHIKLPERLIPDRTIANGFRERVTQLLKRLRIEKAFVRFVSIRFVYLLGTTLATPLFPLYFVRVIALNDAWIGLINTAQTSILLLGYFYWTQTSRNKGSRFVLLTSTLGMSLYPMLISQTHNLHAIVIIAGISGFFQAGIDLVFFDELMKTIPEDMSPIFVAIAQTLSQLSTFLAPMISAWLGDQLGIGIALFISGLVRLMGFSLFWKLG